LENGVSDIVLFFGRFHPLVVHLPIGFLLLGVILYFISFRKGYEKYLPALDFTLLLGGLSGVLACALGYMLSLDGGYQLDALSLHQWLGIALTVVSFALLGLRKAKVGTKYMMSGGFGGLLVLLVFTGHLGGNLTHGSAYLTQYAPNPVRSLVGLDPKVKRAYKKVTNIDSALVYEDILAPILETRCISCHNQDKRKGELLMTSVENLMKGGESGAAIVPGNATSSELIRRVTLPQDDEHFMPPEGKTPLTKVQVQMLEWWIDQGAKSGATLHALNADAKSMDRFENYLGLGKYQSILNTPIDPIDPSVIEELETAGFSVSVLAENVNYLDVSVQQGTELTKNKLQKLEKAKDHIVWLDLKNSGINDDMLSVLSNLPNLLKLRLDRNEITDEGAVHLTKLTQLEYINLSFTKISERTVDEMLKVNGSTRIYHYQSGVQEPEV
jgi:uncharacterized membrane protein